MNSGTNGEADEDRCALERVLDQLYDFGDGPASKKKLRSQKKKKRKRYEEEEEEEEEEIPTVEDICRDTGGVRADRVHAETEQTGPPVRQVSQVSQVEVVSFQDPRKKLNARQTAGPDRRPITEKQRSVRQEELSLEKARLEVHRFGITGYEKEQQRVFEQDRAIMLGARPPKKSFVNYKQLQQQIKDKKQKAKEEVQPDLKDKKKKQSNQRDKKKKKKAASSSSGTAPTGQVGRFKNGMLILSSKEIQKIKGNKPGR